MDADADLLVVIDLQARLMPAISGGEAAVADAGRLIDGARALGIPVLATEQYPQGLGPTVDVIRDRLDPSEIVSKITFSSWNEHAFRDRVIASGRRRLVVCGTEAHVCVLQTVLDAARAGFQLAVVADAVASRAPASKALALDRMARHGVEIVSTEMVLFEWLGRAGDDRFKAVLPLIR
ncbi:hydrolase [Tistrella mobilis]|uniref:hydrolase n=1 Tax=Tistrella mobilis TaxID=171437 RepID=UPI0035575030